MTPPRYLVAIDLSMRSAGLVGLDNSGNLVACQVIPTIKEEYDDEALLHYMQERVIAFWEAMPETPNALVIEGLSFNSKSQRADLVAGNWWNIRRSLWLMHDKLPMFAYPVMTWRSKVIDLSKKGKENLTSLYGKEFLKKAVVEKLPAEVRKQFDAHIDDVEWPKKYPAAKKREAIYDLADAYFLGQHHIRFHSL